MVGLLLIAIALYFVFSGSSADGTPKLVVDQQKIDYGDVRLGTPESFTIKVTNTGAGVLKFKEAPYIQVLEGC